VNNQEQGIKIAGACGWKVVLSDLQSGLDVVKDGERKPLPDYLNDLNAMHAVEEYWKDKTISKPDPQNPSAMLHGLSFVLQYHRQLALVTGAQNGVVFHPDIQWHASAAQRAEAFLRTIGKWEN